MADRADRNRWLLNAQDEKGADTAAQILWLREQRKAYAKMVNDGDWEAQEIAADGGSSKSRRGVSDKNNHDAIVDALRHLGDTDLGGTGALLQVNCYPGVG